MILGPSHRRCAALVLVAALFAPIAPAVADEPAEPKKPAAGEEKPAGEDAAAKAAEALRRKVQPAEQTGNLKLKVESGVFSEFPGFDLTDLEPAAREKLVKEANKVYCTCGCRGDTVARCVVLDPTCATAKKMLQKMLDDLEDGDRTAPRKATGDASE